MEPIIKLDHESIKKLILPWIKLSNNAGDLFSNTPCPINWAIQAETWITKATQVAFGTVLPNTFAKYNKINNNGASNNFSVKNKKKNLHLQ